MPTRLWIALPDGVHNTCGLEILSGDKNLVIRFEKLCVDKLMRGEVSKKLGTFFQGGHDNKTWKYFEFLCGSHHCDLILKLAMEIADELELDLEIGE
ncbi:MAG: hypothetical protein Q8P07_00290 [bacterium]|nr:hypothetical protein [bacterium]